MASASAPSGVPRMKSASWGCIGGYTFRMKHIVWLVLLGIAAGFGYWMWSAARRLEARRRASEERFATFIAQNLKPGAPAAAAPAVAAPAVAAPKLEAAPAAALEPQWLLLEAAAKAGDAGEPALSIQLYARLIARYPGSPLAAQARAGVEQQKSKLARP